MRIALLCSTRRGYQSLKHLYHLAPESEFLVFSFKETPWEPPFFDDIRQFTESINGSFFKARQIEADKWSHLWDSTLIDLMLAVNWRYIIPPDVYSQARLGTFAFHDSLLPKYRGFSPTVWAIINGEDHTGVTLFEISENFDEGDIVDQEIVPIGSDDTIAVVFEKVTSAYIRLLEKNLQMLLSGTAPRHPQKHEDATYCCKRFPEDNKIDWAQPTKRIYNLIRAVTSPYPGAFTYHKGRKLLVWSAALGTQDERYVGRVPGRVIKASPNDGVEVLTGDGSLVLKSVQLEGVEESLAPHEIIRFGETLGQEKNTDA